jgi:hypothetical protein
MINVLSTFLHNNFKEKTCDVLVWILFSTQRSKVQSFSQLFFPTNEMDEKIHKT